MERVYAAEEIVEAYTDLLFARLKRNRRDGSKMD
jgi:hypothetical protein